MKDEDEAILAVHLYPSCLTSFRSDRLLSYRILPVTSSSKVTKQDLKAVAKKATRGFPPVNNRSPPPQSW